QFEVAAAGVGRPGFCQRAPYQHVAPAPSGQVHAARAWRLAPRQALIPNYYRRRGGGSAGCTPGAVSAADAGGFDEADDGLRVNAEPQHQDGHQQHHDAAGAQLPTAAGVAQDMLRLVQEHDHGDAHVVIQADGAADDDTDHEPPQARLHADGDGVKLADEAGGQRDAGQRNHHDGHDRGQVRAAPEQAAIVFQRIGVRPGVGAGDQGDHTKGAEHGDDVGRQVETGGFDGNAFAGGNHGQQIADLGNRRVAQQALDVVLHQRQHVANDHGQEGDQRDQAENAVAVDAGRDHDHWQRAGADAEQ